MNNGGRAGLGEQADKGLWGSKNSKGVGREKQEQQLRDGEKSNTEGVEVHEVDSWKTCTLIDC